MKMEQKKQQLASHQQSIERMKNDFEAKKKTRKN